MFHFTDDGDGFAFRMFSPSNIIAYLLLGFLLSQRSRKMAAVAMLFACLKESVIYGQVVERISKNSVHFMIEAWIFFVISTNHNVHFQTWSHFEFDLW